MLRRRSHRRRLGPPTGISRGAGPGRELGCGCDCRASAALDLGGPRRSGSAFTRAPSSREALWSLYTRGRAGAGLLIRRSGDTPCVPRPFPAGRVAFHSVVLDKHQWNPPSLRTGGFRRSRARVARPGLRAATRARLVRHPASGAPRTRCGQGRGPERLRNATAAGPESGREPTEPGPRGRSPRGSLRPTRGTSRRTRAAAAWSRGSTLEGRCTASAPAGAGAGASSTAGSDAPSRALRPPALTGSLARRADPVTDDGPGDAVASSRGHGGG